MSAHQLSDHLHLAARAQRGRNLAPGVLEALSAASRQTLSVENLLPLDQTDNLFAAYSDAFHKCLAGEKPHMYLRTAQAELSAIFSRLEHIGACLRDKYVVLFSRDFLYTGAVKVPASPFFAAAEALLRLEVDDLRAASSDGSQGLLVDSLERENELELWCWGDEWLALAANG
jgi:hypothetical protein